MRKFLILFTSITILVSCGSLTSISTLNDKVEIGMTKTEFLAIALNRAKKDAMNETINYTNNLANFDNSKIPLEQQICLFVLFCLVCLTVQKNVSTQPPHPWHYVDTDGREDLFPRAGMQQYSSRQPTRQGSWRTGSSRRL